MRTKKCEKRLDRDGVTRALEIISLISHRYTVAYRDWQVRGIDRNLAPSEIDRFRRLRRLHLASIEIARSVERATYLDRTKDGLSELFDLKYIDLYSNQEIAERMCFSVRSVQRKILQLSILFDEDDELNAELASWISMYEEDL